MSNYIRPIFKRNEKVFPTDFEVISLDKKVDEKTYVSTERLVKSFIDAGSKLQTFRNYEFQKDDENQRFDQAGDFYEETQFELDNLHNVRNDVINELNNKTESEQNVNKSNQDVVSEIEKSTQDTEVQNPTDSQES